MSNTSCYGKNFCERMEFPHTEFFTRFVAYPNPSSLGPYQPTTSSNPDPCSLSEQSSLVAPSDLRARQAPVELAFAVTLPTHSLVPETAYEADQPRCHSWGKLPALIVSAGETCSELVLLVVGLSAVVVFVAAGAFVVVVGVAAAVALGSGEIGGLNHSAATRGTSVEDLGSW